MKNLRADLHVHSRYSDGVLSIDELEKMAIENNIDIIAITDHDNILSHKEINSKKRKILMITGFEMSTFFNDEQVHILGFLKGNKVPLGIDKYFERQRINREKRVYKIIEKLKKYFDIEITYDEIASFADNVIVRPHIAHAIGKKFGISEQTAYDMYIGDNKPAFVPSSKLNTFKAIDILHKNNALTIVAHPKLIKTSTLESIIEYGVDGIECIHYLHKNKDVKRYKKLAKANNLLITGGSDFHSFAKNYGFGKNYIEKEDIDIFLERIGI